MRGPGCRLNAVVGEVARWAAVALVSVGLLQSGCAAWSYEHVQLGQELREYERAFPEGKTRRTKSALCYLERDLTGRTDAVVLLLTRNRVIAGKLHAVHVERRLGFQHDSSYRLRGELDPRLARLQGTGPIDTLRAVADELTGNDGTNFIHEANGWVAGGLVRLIQRWPEVGDAGPAFPRLTEVLEQIPLGGRAQIAITPDGTYEIEYAYGDVR